MAPDAASSLGIATALGAHAIALWAATVAVALLVALLGWRWRRHRLQAPHRGDIGSPARVAVRIGAAFALVVAVAASFAELAEGTRAGALTGRMDDAFALALRQHTPEPVLQVSSWLTHAGDPAWLTVLGAGLGLALLRSGRLALAVGWVAAVLGNAVLNRTLKEVFRRIRPPHDAMFTTAEGFSFPSGHTSGSLVAYGMLAFVAVRVLPPAWHLPVVGVAVVVAVTTAFSRVFLGVHHASDVLAGTLSGGTWLVVCIGAVEWHRRRQERLGR